MIWLSGRLRPKKEHELHSITRQTPLAFLLPRPQDEGTCAVALVDYLINYTQNEFLETFRRIAGVEGSVVSIVRARMHTLTHSHTHSHIHARPPARIHTLPHSHTGIPTFTHAAPTHARRTHVRHTRSLPRPHTLLLTVVCKL